MEEGAVHDDNLPAVVVARLRPVRDERAVVQVQTAVSLRVEVTGEERPRPMQPVVTSWLKYWNWGIDGRQ